jgi:hypothetical protein
MAKVHTQSLSIGCEVAPVTASSPGVETSESSGEISRLLYDGDESNTDDEFINMDPLASMTFKSLQNLASYPNPSQKRARKALMCTKPVSHIAGGYIHASSSPKAADLGSVGSPRATTRQPAAAWTDGTQANNISESYPAAGGNSVASLYDNKHSMPALPEGSGVPQPLTAGPPGQRQYRASTFEATLKALQARGQREAFGDEWDNGSTSHLFPRVLRDTEDEWDPSAGHSVTPCPRFDSKSPTIQSVATSMLHDASYSKPEFAQSLEPFRHFGNSGKIMTTHGEANSMLSYPCTPILSDARPEPSPPCYGTASIQSRKELTDTYWYAGSSFLSKSTAEAVIDARFRRLEHTVGVIGDRRPGKAKSRHLPISVDQASKMSVSDHAQPLLNAAFQTLLEWREHYYNNQQSSRLENFENSS